MLLASAPETYGMQASVLSAPILSDNSLVRSCNICGSTEFVRNRTGMLCGDCGANARARLLWLCLQRTGVLRRGARVLHIAPERALAPRIRDTVGSGYEPVDKCPEDYGDIEGIRKLDLAIDVAGLPSGRYDLVIHSHVMEHVRCNITAVLYHLTRALKSDGLQVCCIPVIGGQSYSEDLGKLKPDEATERFGQFDHVRQFGAVDLHSTLGMLFRLPATYNLLEHFSERDLVRHRIPRVSWVGWSPNNVFVFRQEDILLTL